MPYKHQIEVAKAANELRRAGCPIRVRFVGADWGAYGQLFRKLLRQLDPQEEFLIWPGSMPFSTLHSEYLAADAFLFASSCENLPNILIEAMAAGLPIACSNRGPMPEVLDDAGIYFDPLSASEIAEAMRRLFDHADLRVRVAAQAKPRGCSASTRWCGRRCTPEQRCGQKAEHQHPQGQHAHGLAPRHGADGHGHQQGHQQSTSPHA